MPYIGSLLADPIPTVTRRDGSPRSCPNLGRPSPRTVGLPYSPASLRADGQVAVHIWVVRGAIPPHPYLSPAVAIQVRRSGLRHEAEPCLTQAPPVAAALKEGLQYYFRRGQILPRMMLREHRPGLHQTRLRPGVPEGDRRFPDGTTEPCRLRQLAPRLRISPEQRQRLSQPKAGEAFPPPPRLFIDRKHQCPPKERQGCSVLLAPKVGFGVVHGLPVYLRRRCLVPLQHITATLPAPSLDMLPMGRKLMVTRSHGTARQRHRALANPQAVLAPPVVILHIGLCPGHSGTSQDQNGGQVDAQGHHLGVSLGRTRHAYTFELMLLAGNARPKRVILPEPPSC